MSDKEQTDDIRAKIIHALSVYPKLSHSPLQVAIGTATPSRLWKPILNVLVEEGLVYRVEENHVTHKGRTQCITMYQLTDQGVTHWNIQQANVTAE